MKLQYPAQSRTPAISFRVSIELFELLAAGQAPALLTAFSQESPPPAAFHVQAQALLPAMPNPMPERTFSDFLPDINWADARMDDWPTYAGGPAGQ